MLLLTTQSFLLYGNRTHNLRLRTQSHKALDQWASLIIKTNTYYSVHVVTDYYFLKDNSRVRNEHSL